MPNHIFISYAREDQTYARALADHLRQRGFDVWVDNRIDFGDRWWQTIVDALHASAAFIVVMTPHSANSEWVHREVLLALQDRKPIFPLLLRGETFPTLVDVQYITVTGSRMPPKSFIDRIRPLLEAHAERNPPPQVLLPPEQQDEVRLRLQGVYEEIYDAMAKGQINLYDLTPRRFEEFIAAIFENHGYEVELTKSTRDGGYDIIAIGQNPIDLDLRIIVECKRYHPDRPVSISVARELWGIIADPTNQFDRGIVATTSRLSPDAKRALETSYWRLSEMDHEAIMSYAGFVKIDDGVWIPEHLI